jgi:hypothetical protein
VETFFVEAAVEVAPFALSLAGYWFTLSCFPLPSGSSNRSQSTLGSVALLAVADMSPAKRMNTARVYLLVRLPENHRNRLQALALVAAVLEDWPADDPGRTNEQSEITKFGTSSSS